MDRLETQNYTVRVLKFATFIFQYGQIRNGREEPFLMISRGNLYSSMDRLETLWYMLLEQTNYQIYIPVWIDQKHIE